MSDQGDQFGNASLGTTTDDASEVPILTNEKDEEIERAMLLTKLYLRSSEPNKFYDIESGDPITEDPKQHYTKLYEESVVEKPNFKFKDEDAVKQMYINQAVKMNSVTIFDGKYVDILTKKVLHAPVDFDKEVAKKCKAFLAKNEPQANDLPVVFNSKWSEDAAEITKAYREEAQRRKNEEAQRKKEEAQRKKEEDQRKKEEDQRLKEEAETQRKEDQRLKEEAEANRLWAISDAEKKKEEDEAKERRKRQEAEEKKRAADKAAKENKSKEAGKTSEGASTSKVTKEDHNYTIGQTYDDELADPHAGIAVPGSIPPDAEESTRSREEIMKDIKPTSKVYYLIKFREYLRLLHRLYNYSLTHRNLSKYVTKVKFLKNEIIDEYDKNKLTVYEQFLKRYPETDSEGARSRTYRNTLLKKLRSKPYDSKWRETV